MTLFLASVRDEAEAELAVAGGADIVDLKEAAHGALGAVPAETVRRVVRAVGRRAATSAVCGDLPMQPETLAEAARVMADAGVTYVKVGFFPSERALDCAAALAGVARATRLVAVVFADLGQDAALLAALSTAGFHGVMMDTAQKTHGRLLDHASIPMLSAFIASAHAAGLKVGLAGSLETPDVPRLLPLGPDFLGFRGALCGGTGRAGRIDPQAVAHIRALIPDARRAGAETVDYRLLAARGYAPGTADPSLGTDRIFVREFVLPVEIGAYSFERGHAQKVRFDVEAEVIRVTDDPQDMRHVFSYDVIMDAIRSIVADGHVELSETLAERVAQRVLAEPRVTRVRVRVEKLELGPAGVGVEIERRAPERRPSLQPVPGENGRPIAAAADRRGGGA